MKRLAALLLAVALVAIILHPVYARVNAPFSNNGPHAPNYPIPPCPPCGCGCVAPTSTVVADGLRMALVAPMVQLVCVNVSTPSGDFPIPPCPPSGCGSVPTATVPADGSRMAPILPQAGLSG